MALALRRRRGLWERLVSLISGGDPFARPVPGYQTQGFATQGQVGTSDGFKVGDVKWAVGTTASVLRDNPGWKIADGTASVVIDGVSYAPNLVGKFVIGADGATYPIGGTGGGGSISFGSITQPVFAAPAAHSSFSEPAHTNLAAHTVTHESGHGVHPFNNTEVTATPGSGVWVGSQVSAVALQAALSHANETGGRHTGLSLDHNHDAFDHNHDSVSLDHNHDAPARTTDVAIASTSAPLPPYVALWPLLKCA